MTDYNNAGEGAIFTNDDGSLEGNIELDGTKHRVSARKKQLRNGTEIMVMEIELGSLFPNQKTKDTQPDMTGKVSIEGQLYRVAAWSKKSQKTGKDYLSMKLSEVTEQPQQQPEPEVAQPSDGDIPF
tara:strand:- start:514 stop:894 length:381 start_codon:yes stop_codon:yes gene_type:complete